MADLRVQFDVRFSPSMFRWGLVSLLVSCLAGELQSENVTLTTYYPAPSGVYTQMITTANTFLARDGGYILAGPLPTSPAVPASKFNVNGGIGIGNTSFIVNAAPANGMIVQGNVGIGTSAPTVNEEVAGIIHAHDNGTTPDNGYGGDIRITRPPLSGQYINFVRSGIFPWSIGTVYNSSNFAIGQAQALDSNFTAPAFVIGTGGNVGIGNTAPGYRLTVSNGAIGGNWGLTPNYANWASQGTGDGGAAVYNSNEGVYQSLMIVGNNSRGDGIRRVGVWDRLNVNGRLGIQTPIPYADVEANGDGVILSRQSCAVITYADGAVVNYPGFYVTAIAGFYASYVALGSGSAPTNGPGGGTLIRCACPAGGCPL